MLLYQIIGSFAISAAGFRENIVNNSQVILISNEKQTVSKWLLFIRRSFCPENHGKGVLVPGYLRDKKCLPYIPGQYQKIVVTTRHLCYNGKT